VVNQITLRDGNGSRRVEVEDGEEEKMK